MLGVLSPSFPSLGKHANAETQECAVNLLPSLMRTSRALLLVATPHWAIKIILALALNVLPCHHPHVRYHFAVFLKNNDRMKILVLERYASSTFNTCPHRPLHCMAGPPIKINVSPSAKPRAFHTPAFIPLHWQQQVHADLPRDEALGILEKVPHGEPTQWCHRMLITRKHDGTPPRTVDLSPLNKFCRPETFASETPFKLVRRVPSNTWKTVTDAWNGYHSVPLRESDRHLTIFITPFGRWRYTRAPQGLWSLSYSSVTLKYMSRPDSKIREHLVYLFSIVWIRSKKRYIFLKQVKIVLDWLRIAFLRNMARRGSCQMSANKDAKISFDSFR